MKKFLLAIFFCSTSFFFIQAQCVPSCSVYGMSSITCTTIPVAGHNTVTSFSSFDDGMSGALPIGFTFTFFCNAYTQFQVSTNGFLTFDLNNTWNNGCCSGNAIPSAGQPNDFIALHWNDLNLNLGGDITYTTVGTSPNQRCIITYTDVARYGNASELTSGHIILYEGTNQIEIHSVAIDASGQATQGIEDMTGSKGYATPGCNASAFNLVNTAYRFSAGGVPTAPTAITGTNSLCEGDITTFVASQMPTALSYNWALPTGWVGTSNNSVLTATAGASGQVSVTATYSCGTSGATIFNVNTIPAPRIDNTSASPVFICSGETVTISATVSGATSYTLEPVGVAGTLPFTVTPSSSTSYYIVAENAAGCRSFNAPLANVMVKATPVVAVSSGSVCQGQPFSLSPSGATSYTLSSIFSVVTVNTAGTHTFSAIGTNSNGCISTPAIATVVVNPLPAVTASADRTSICIKESTTLNAGGATSYQWSNASTSQSVDVTPAGPTSYTVTGTSNGCSKTAVVFIDVTACTGIENNSFHNSSTTVYPNPSNGEFTINAGHNLTAIVYDMLGRKVFEKTLGEGIHKINLQNFANGKYLLQTTSDSGHQNMVLIKN